MTNIGLMSAIIKHTALMTLWIIWCSIHSGMISVTFNNYIKKRFVRYYKFYRIFYNFIAMTTLIPLIFYSQSFKGSVLFRWEGPMVLMQLFLLAISATLFIFGGLKYDFFQFMGIRQIRSGKSNSTLSENGEIHTTGILGITRHPWYLAAIILVWVDYRDMYVSTLIVNIVLTIYIVIGTVLEERKLVIEFGDIYRNYKSRVSMLFPTKWISKKFIK